MASPETGAFHSKDRRDDFPIFIHSELDDYGLTAIEFRVYARLARRAGQHGRHSESIPNMANEFDYSDRSIQRALKVLTACCLITRHSRPGKTDEYSLNPRMRWKDRSTVRRIREQIYRPGGDMRDTGQGGDTRPGGDMRDTGVVTPQHGVVVTPQHDEGTPSEGTPIKEEEGRGYPFDHFAVVEYSETLQPEPPLAIFQAESIADSVEDSTASRAVWTQVLGIFKGNGYQRRLAGNAVDRYKSEMAKIAAGKRDAPIAPARVRTLREKYETEGAQ